MFYIIVGCGRVGAELASTLYRKDHQVCVIDHVGSSFGHLPPDYRGRTIEAEVLNEGVLEKAGAAQADGLASVTNEDATNAVVAHVARTRFGIANVVSRNYDPRWRAVHEALGLETVSSTAWGAQRMEELLYSPTLRAVFSAGNGEVEVYELLIDGAWAGRSLGELLAGSQCVAISHTRGGRAALPGPEMRLATGDVLHVSAALEGVEVLRSRLARKEA